MSRPRASPQPQPFPQEPPRVPRRLSLCPAGPALRRARGPSCLVSGVRWTSVFTGPSRCLVCCAPFPSGFEAEAEGVTPDRLASPRCPLEAPPAGRLRGDVGACVCTFARLHTRNKVRFASTEATGAGGGGGGGSRARSAGKRRRPRGHQLGRPCPLLATRQSSPDLDRPRKEGPRSPHTNGSASRAPRDAPVTQGGLCSPERRHPNGAGSGCCRYFKRPHPSAHMVTVLSTTPSHLPEKPGPVGDSAVLQANAETGAGLPAWTARAG